MIDITEEKLIHEVCRTSVLKCENLQNIAELKNPQQ